MTAATTSIAPRPVQVPVGDAVLIADLAIPERARGLVVFAHGSGSSRLSSRNRAVALALQHGGFGILLLDLLTQAEERVDVRTAEFRFDISLLGTRVSAAVDWACADERTAPFPIGLFGASTGAAAALIAAADRPAAVRAVVSRGGRPDLAGSALERVRAPSLLIVGERDEVVIRPQSGSAVSADLAREALIVPRATHLFEEPGTLERVVELAIDWFERHLMKA